MPHSIINGYKRVLAVAVETDYTFPLAEKVTAERRAAGGETQPSALTGTPRMSPGLKGLAPACVRGACPEKGLLLPYVVYKRQKNPELPGVLSSRGLWHLGVAEMSLILHREL